MIDHDQEEARLILLQSANAWITESLTTLAVQNCGELSHDICKAPVKADMAPILRDGLIFTDKLQTLLRELLVEASLAKTQGQVVSKRNSHG